MDAQALVAHEDESVSLEDVTLEDPGPGEIGIRTLYSGVSIGTELNLLRGNVSWGPYPICTGYQAVGVVETAGDAVAGFEAGDTVYYGENAEMRLPDGAGVSPTTGTHCSRAVIDPDETLAVGRVPDGAGADVASLFVMPAVGLNGVDEANVRLGDTVVVHGTGLVGLGVVGCCALRGAEVIGIDLERSRLEVAASMGADHLVDASADDVESAVEERSPGGADVVFEATGIPACIDTATALVRRNGKFVFQGDYGEEPITFTERVLNAKQLTGYFPSGYGGEAGARTVLENVASGALPWERVVTHRIDPGEAPAMYDALNDGERDEVLGIVVEWSDGA